MAIQFDEVEKVFLLHTKNTTYAMGIVADSLVSHLYWGKRIRKLQHLESFYPCPEHVFSSEDAWLPSGISSEAITLEYGIEGGTDRRHPTIEIRKTV